ncbi:MAG: DUF899 family protein [Candidatus Heimdallarchaeota archaeon]|nr:DUF899 family protein [Candidatus Heimdallarchaeota archaeon]MDH5646333.1 DUF899 family protein [Candidatus Heimdallarchaeota archaeon]
MFETDEKYKELYETIRQKQSELREYIKANAYQEVDDYILTNPDGEKKTLSDLFGNKTELIVIHNMGENCPYCNLWAQGFMGLTKHIEDRTAFVVVSPDAPVTQKRIIQERGYNFKMASAEGTKFIEDMGFGDKDGRMPGFSTFKKEEDGKIYRIARDFFEPFDPYNSVWHLFALLPEGVNNWSPKFKYD